MERQQRDRQDDQGDGADDVRRSDAPGMEQESRCAGQDGGRQEDFGPARQAPVAEHGEQHDGAG